MAKKGAREKIKLVHKATGHYYTTVKNKRNTTEKLKMRKYNPRTRQHEDYTEEKIK